MGYRLPIWRITAPGISLSIMRTARSVCFSQNSFNSNILSHNKYHVLCWSHLCQMWQRESWKWLGFWCFLMFCPKGNGWLVQCNQRFKISLPAGGISRCSKLWGEYMFGICLQNSYDYIGISKMIYFPNNFYISRVTLVAVFGLEYLKTSASRVNIK